MTKFIVRGGGGDGTLFHFINVVPFFFDQDGFRQFPLKFVGLYVAIDLGGRVLHGGGQSRHVGSVVSSKRVTCDKKSFHNFQFSGSQCHHVGEDIHNTKNDLVVVSCTVQPC